MAFRGTFDYSLDAKNRLTVPARFRAELTGTVVLARGVERCVEVWRPQDHDAYAAEALALFPRMSPQGRKLRLFFASGSHETEVDSAGRIMVPPFLLEHAGLAKEVVVTGAEDCLQLWDRTAWADFSAGLTDDINDITAQLGHPA